VTAKTVSRVKTSEAMIVVLALLWFGGVEVEEGRRCFNGLLDDPMRRVEIEFVVDYRLGRRSFTLNFLNLLVFEGVLRSFEWNSLRWIMSSWCCHKVRVARTEARAPRAVMVSSISLSHSPCHVRGVGIEPITSDILI
jgi:hypothetical protein